MPRENLPQIHAHAVILVGAGPGDPDLLTLRGKKSLAAADIVVYDALSNPQILLHAVTAEHLYVGKRAGHHSMSQADINALLVAEAKKGRRVVRLKGGDPFVFGRGGEECQALRDAGVPFEVVPGVTAAVAAAAYAGIPITHRDLNPGFTIATGHTKEPEAQDVETRDRQARDPAAAGGLDWPSLAKQPCVCFYMGVKSLPEITARLIEHGMSRDTPAATIQWGTTPRQRVAVATLATLAEEVERQRIAAPAVTIVGEVVRLRQALRWFDDPAARPLFGRRVLVTRTREQASELRDALAAAGADVLEAPTIQFESPDPAATWAAVGDARRFDWVLFTSANGVRHALALAEADGRDLRPLMGAKFGVVGEKTRAALAGIGVRADAVAEVASGEGLADTLVGHGEVAGRRFLLLRADIGSARLVEKLHAAGAAEVADVAVYETKPADALPQDVAAALDAGDVEWATFTSSSTARNLVALLGGPAKLAGVKLASIGPQTSATLRELGLKIDVEADEPSVVALAAAVVEAGRHE